MARMRKPADTGQGAEDQLAASPPSSADAGTEPGAGQPPPERTEFVAPSERHAEQLRESVAPLFMFASMTQAFKNIDATAFKLFRDRLLVDCGSPTDPIEVMMIEQLALAHFNMGLLHCRAANSSSFECAGVYSNAPARLMAESRRSALAIQGYRAASRQLASSPAPGSIVISGDAMESQETPEKNPVGSELSTTSRGGIDEPTVVPFPGPEAIGDRPPEPLEAAWAEPRRARKDPGRHMDSSALGTGTGRGHS